MAKKCGSCGAMVPDDKKFCTECGAAVLTEPVKSEETMNSTVKGTSPQINRRTLASGPFEPISTKGYIGIMLIMCIPIVGQIIMIVWALGGCRKINKRNFARACVILMIIGLVISLFTGFMAKRYISNAIAEMGIGSGSYSTGNEDLDELRELANVLEGLEGITGEESGGNSLNELIDNVEAINKDAEAKNNGWPKSLRKYPEGTAKAVASYRTEITGTDEETMMDYIADLKKDGFEYKDFYEFGMSEQDMLSSNGWWGTDGDIYLSISLYDGVLTVDHTNELPDIASYFN